jgi:hypothetical protein
VRGNRCRSGDAGAPPVAVSKLLTSLPSTRWRGKAYVTGALRPEVLRTLPGSGAGGSPTSCPASSEPAVDAVGRAFAVSA